PHHFLPRVPAELAGRHADGGGRGKAGRDVRAPVPADVPGVIMILPYMEAGGTERHALHLVRGLLRDYRVGLLSPDGPMLDRFLGLGVARRAFARLEQDPLGGLRALRRGLPPRLVVVGDGSQRAELERRAGAPDLAGRVHFAGCREDAWRAPGGFDVMVMPSLQEAFPLACLRSEEHTSELQSRENLVCRLLLEKKK